MVNLMGIRMETSSATAKLMVNLTVIQMVIS